LCPVWLGLPCRVLQFPPAMQTQAPPVQTPIQNITPSCKISFPYQDSFPLSLVCTLYVKQSNASRYVISRRDNQARVFLASTQFNGTGLIPLGALGNHQNKQNYLLWTKPQLCPLPGNRAYARGRVFHPSIPLPTCR